MTQGAFHIHCKKNHQGHADQPVGPKVSVSSQDFMLRHFVQVSITDMEAAIIPDDPSVEKARADS